MILRNKLGQFRKSLFIPIGLVLVLVGGLAIGIFHRTFASTIEYKTVEKFVEVDNLAPKIEDLKDSVVTRLSTECEYIGWTEDSKPYVVEDNKRGGVQVVFGAWQYVPSTAVYYYKKLYGKDISEVEAINIVTDWDKGFALTKDIIFQVVGGIWEWKNCADKLGLAKEIEFIRKLE